MDGGEQAVGADQLGALGRIFLRDQPFDRHVRKVRIGVVTRAVLIGETLRLGLQVDRQRRLEARAFQVEMLEDVEHLQGRDPLRVRAEGINVGAAIARFVRLDPFGLVRGEILVAQPAADPLEIGVDGARDFALVKGVAAAFGDQAEGARKVGVAENLSRSRAFAVVQAIGADRIVDFFDSAAGLAEAGEAAADIICDHVGDRRPRLGMRDDGLEQLLPRQLAVTLVHRPPAVDRPRHRHADRAIGGQGAALGAAAHRREVEPAGALARSRETGELLRLRVPDHRIDIAADAVRGRLEQAKARVDRNRRIDRRAATLQNVDPRLCRERMRGSRRAAEPISCGARREAGADGAVAALDVGSHEAVGTGVPDRRHRSIRLGGGGRRLRLRALGEAGRRQ